MAYEQPKKELSKEEQFVQDMLKRAEEKVSPTMPGNINEDPDQIAEILEAIKKKQRKI